MTLKVGDRVTWRSGKSKARKHIYPLGIANCEIIGFGVSEDGQPAARLKLPELFAPTTECNAYIADLEAREAEDVGN
jgi:hypothetical protein